MSIHNYLLVEKAILNLLLLAKLNNSALQSISVIDHLELVETVDKMIFSFFNLISIYVE